MILAKLTDAGRYSTLLPSLEAGFDFLRQPGLAELANGRHEIDGERVFAIVAREMGRGKAYSPLEYHRRYLDIQYVVRGVELIGWSPFEDCGHTRDAFDLEKDLGFFLDRPGCWCRVAAGSFAIFFPEDAHAPLAGMGPIHKVVVKVAV